MKNEFKRRRRLTLRERLSTPRARRILAIAGIALVALSVIWLTVLAIVVFGQPADRAFTRTDEWITIAILALPAVAVLVAAAIFARKKTRKKQA